MSSEEEIIQEEETYYCPGPHDTLFLSKQQLPMAKELQFKCVHSPSPSNSEGEEDDQPEPVPGAWNRAWDNLSQIRRYIDVGDSDEDEVSTPTAPWTNPEENRINILEKKLQELSKYYYQVAQMMQEIRRWQNDYCDMQVNLNNSFIQNFELSNGKKI